MAVFTVDPGARGVDISNLGSSGVAHGYSSTRDCLEQFLGIDVDISGSAIDDDVSVDEVFLPSGWLKDIAHYRNDLNTSSVLS